MRKLYDKWRSSGISMKAFSQRYAISPTTFSYWVKKFKKEELPIPGKIRNEGFSQIPIPDVVSNTDQKALAVIHFPSGTCLELFYPAEAAFIKKLIQ